jgi:hypothetical protein
VHDPALKSPLLFPSTARLDTPEVTVLWDVGLPTDTTVSMAALLRNARASRAKEPRCTSTRDSGWGVEASRGTKREAQKSRAGRYDGPERAGATMTAGAVR